MSFFLEYSASKLLYTIKSCFVSRLSLMRVPNSWTCSTLILEGLQIYRFCSWQQEAPVAFFDASTNFLLHLFTCWQRGLTQEYCYTWWLVRGEFSMCLVWGHAMWSVRGFCWHPPGDVDGPLGNPLAYTVGYISSVNNINLHQMRASSWRWCIVAGPR